MNFLDARLPDRFWSKVQPCPMSGCWLWFGATDASGYGSFLFEERTVKAHRLSYEVLVGTIPPGLQTDHLCRVRCCVNPAHLEPVTQLENVRRGDSGKRNASKTHCLNGHPFEGENLFYLHGKRMCRECHRARSLAEYHRRKRAAA